MRADQDRQREDDDKRNQIADDEYFSDFRTMPQTAPIASAPSGWRSIVFTIAAWSLAGWAMIAAVWWLGTTENFFSAKKPPASHQSR